MSKTDAGSNWSNKIEINRLENQLLTGHKLVQFSDFAELISVPLTDEDRKLIQERIDELKQTL